MRNIYAYGTQFFLQSNIGDRNNILYTREDMDFLSSSLKKKVTLESLFAQFWGFKNCNLVILWANFCAVGKFFL